MADLVIQFLDVGQGDGIYIEFPNGINMLVDLGSTKGKRLAGPDVFKFFASHTRFQNQGQTLNYLILSHADSDHYNMVNDFLTTFNPKIEYFTFSGFANDYGSSLISKLRSRGAQSFGFTSIPAQIVRDDEFGGVEVYCLGWNCTGPSKQRNAWNKNSDSIVLQLVYGKVKIILAGDATTTTEQYILANMSQFKTTFADVVFSLQSNILKVGHHGSARTSSCKEWISAINPEFIFISSDRSGTLDEDLKKTGHRLPQELTLDIIRQNASRLYKKCAEHTYVSSYDPLDYKGYASQTDSSLKDNHTSLPNPYNSSETGWPRAWYQIKTTEAIFTTLVTVGGAYTSDNNEHDQGSQYELRITSDGTINVHSTEDFTNIHPLTPTK